MASRRMSAANAAATTDSGVPRSLPAPAVAARSLSSAGPISSPALGDLTGTLRTVEDQRGPLKIGEGHRGP